MGTKVIRHGTPVEHVNAGRVEIHETAVGSPKTRVTHHVSLSPGELAPKAPEPPKAEPPKAEGPST